MTIDEALENAPPALLDVPICRALSSQTQFRAGDGDEDGEQTGDSPGTMFGHFSTFNDWYEINSWFEGNFLERIAPGAFKRTIKNRSGQSPVRVLLDHGFDPGLGDRPLGIPEILEERQQGPYAEVPLFDGVPRMVVAGLRAGAYGQSFRFFVLRDEWVEEPEPSDDNPRGITERTIKEVRLIEFGPTPFPANPAADAGLRSTTDHFYERLRRRDPATYEAMVARAKTLRTPAKPAGPAPTVAVPAITFDSATTTTTTTISTPAPAGPAVATTEDPPKARHSDDSPTGHSKDAPAKRHSKASSRPASRVNAKPERNTMSTSELEPMTSEEREARQSEVRVRLAEIDSEFNGATLPEETQAEWDDLNEEYDLNERSIAADVARKDRIRELEARHGGERVRQVPTPSRRPDNPFDLAAIRQQARSVDDLPALYRENALRVIDQARYPGSKDRAAAQEQVVRLLDTVDDKEATLARRILVTGSPLYERAFGKYALALSTNGLTSEEQRALAIGAGGTGGFAVPFQLDPTIILTNNGSVNPLRQISRVEQIVGKEWQGITSAGVTVSRAAEAAESTDNAPTLAQPTVKAERVQGFIPFSMEADQDWTALQSEMTRLLADAKDVEEAASFVTGDGVSPNANGIIATLNASSNVTANTFTVGSIYALEDAMPDRFLDNARFLAHRSVYNLARQFDTAGGANLWVRLGEGLPPELIGYPAHRTSAMADSTLVIGDRYLLLGDFRNFLIVDRVGMIVDVIPHLLGANRRPTGQRGLYTMWRNNAKILTDNAFRVLHKAA